MKESLKLMEQMEAQASEQFALETAKKSEREEKISGFRVMLESLQDKIVKLEDQAQKN